MRNKIAFLTVLFILAVATAALAQGKVVQVNAPAAAQGGTTRVDLPQFDEMKTLPIQGLKMVRAGDQIYFISQEGRFAIKGTMVDLWSGKPIKTMADVDEVANRVNLKALGVKEGDLLTYRYGKGPKEVLVFVSPGCHYCQDVEKQMGDMLNEYTFVLVPLPILGPSSVEAVKKLSCAVDNNTRSGLASLLADNYNGLTESDCDLTRAQKSMLTAQVLGATAVPFIIADDGRVQRGAPREGLRSFLKAGTN